MKKFSKLLCVLLSAAMVFTASSYTAVALAAEIKDEPLLKVEMISDPHIGYEGTAETLESAIKNMSADKDLADGVIIAGDLSNDGTVENTEKFYDVLTENCKIENMITAAGNHDMGQMTYSGEETRKIQIEQRNKYLNMNTDKIYYSTEINGFKFIILGDTGENINCATISDEEISFLEAELKDGNENGTPVFVICHWPLAFMNGSWLLWPIWPGGNIDMFTSYRLRNLMSKYDNVFFISGHLHMGFNNSSFLTSLALASVENHSNATYINLPSVGKDCRNGIESTGTGMELEVYKDRVEMYARNYVTGEYYSSCTYTETLENFTPDSMIELPEALLFDESEKDKYPV